MQRPPKGWGEITYVIQNNNLVFAVFNFFQFSQRIQNLEKILMGGVFIRFAKMSKTRLPGGFEKTKNPPTLDGHKMAEFDML